MKKYTIFVAATVPVLLVAYVIYVALDKMHMEKISSSCEKLIAPLKNIPVYNENSSQEIMDAIGGELSPRCGYWVSRDKKKFRLYVKGGRYTRHMLIRIGGEWLYAS